MSRRERPEVRAKKPRRPDPWWQVILIVEREINPTRWRYERVAKHVMAQSPDEASVSAQRMLMTSQKLLDVSYIGRRADHYWLLPFPAE